MWFRWLSCALVLALPAAEAPPRKVAKEVLAFYYGWYGNPEVSGKWNHWKEVDPVKKTIANSTNWPSLGAYDSHDPKVVDQHFRWASKAGLTGFIVSWWAQGDFHDQGMPLILDTARKYKRKITVYYETVPPRGKPAIEGAVNDLLYLLGKYGKHPAWLKVDGKPVVFIYGRALNEIKLEGWKQVIAEVNRKHPGGAIFIGDRISEEAAQIFDGIHTYNPTSRIKGMAPEAIRAWAKEFYPMTVKTAGPKIAAVTVIPGYDDHKLGRPEPRPITHRHDGETYRILWEEAIAANPDWVLITSWNEWHEGSEIEPSAENGELALKQTGEFAPQFLKSRRRTVSNGTAAALGAAR
jgi:hypothetical protein